MSPDAPVLQLTVFATFRVGGPQVRFSALANHLGRSFRHIIVAMDNQFECRDRLDSSLDVTFHPITGRKSSTLANVCMFRRFIRVLKPDVLVTHNWGSIEWAMANWPGLTHHVHIEDGFGPEEANRQLPRRGLVRRVVLGRSQVVVASRKLEKIATETWKLNPGSVCFVPNGIDCDRFARRPADLLVPPGTPAIGTVAALRPEKNLSRLIDAFQILRKLRPCRLDIAGDGPERDALEAQVNKIGLRDDVLFLGYRTDTERIYAGLSVFALSSDTEQMPISVIEAMAAGLPVASTDVGDVREMVSVDNREFVNGHDAKTLAGALEALLKSPHSHTIAARNQSIARQEFSEGRMFATYEALFRNKMPLDFEMT